MMLCVLGDLVEDVVVARPQRVAVAADTDVSIIRRRGGSAANTAVAAAKLGHPVRFIGRVGDDAIGRALVEALRAAGVQPVVQSTGRTGTIIVLIEPDGDRTMLRDRAAAAELDGIPPPGLAGVTWLHVPAYSLVEGPVAAVARAALHDARETGTPTSIDVSSVTIIEDIGPGAFRELVADLAPTVVFCNADEDAALEELTFEASHGPIVVVKHGPDPAFVRGPSGTIIEELPARTIDDVVDTTGAGDAFAAGFIVARLGGGDHGDCLDAAHAAAADWIVHRD